MAPLYSVPLDDPADISNSDWPFNQHRGFGKTSNWGGKYRYGTFSSLVASYVIGYEHFDDLPILNQWRQDSEKADALISTMWDRYLSLNPAEVEKIVELANKNEFSDIYSSRLNSVSTPQENLNFMENVMADYSRGGEANLNIAQLNKHTTGQGNRTTLEPVSERWKRDDLAGYEAELHRGAYANSFNIPQNSIAAYLAGYFVGDRAFESDVLDSRDLKAVMSHEFALNQQRGEFYEPTRWIKNHNGPEIGESHYGVTDPTLPYPNAIKTAFNVGMLDNTIGFFDRYLPHASLALDARNMSSITCITELERHYSSHDATNKTSERKYETAPARPMATSVKLYPFVLAHGYEHALMEYVFRIRKGTQVKFEDLKFWLPKDYDPANTPAKSRTEAEHRIIALRDKTANTAADAEDRAAIARAAEMEPPTPAEQKAFEKALEHIPITICLGGVIADQRPGPELSDNKLDTPFGAEIEDLRMRHQGSDSLMMVTNLLKSDPDSKWQDKISYGCRNKLSEFERELNDIHQIPAFSMKEREYIFAGSIKLFSYIASFAPYINDKSTIQFESLPALSEILQEAKAVEALKASEQIEDDPYLRLTNIKHSTLTNRHILLRSAIVDNVHEMIHAVGTGRIPLEINGFDGKPVDGDRVKHFFQKVRLSGYDRYSDFSVNVPSKEAGGTPRIIDYTYNVVRGQVFRQGRGSANQTGQLRHSKDVSSSTTDLPVESKLDSLYRSLHRNDFGRLPNPHLVESSQRSMLTTTIEVGETLPAEHWGGWSKGVPTKEQAEKTMMEVLQARGLDGLAPYLDQGDPKRNARRKLMIERVREARGR